ncbi:MAG: hypothetical protein QOI41_7297 [Myxococcales bacterium]|nr:hypothetical protein [Myxococcales bacterium]
MRGRGRSRSVLAPALVLVMSCTFVLGCKFLKKKGADGGADEDAATVTVTGTGAKNEKDVLRYASETKVADEPGVIGKDVTKARTFPASGAEVATLSKGTQVIQLAKFFSTGVLVIFTDPAASDGSKLMGWITPESLAAAPAATTTNTATPVFTAAKPVDAGAKDSGVTDAGADAGGAADAGKAADAGATTGGAAITAPPGAGGTCPGGFVLVQPPALCRKICASDLDCPKGSGAVCKSLAGKKVCAIK